MPFFFFLDEKIQPWEKCGGILVVVAIMQKTYDESVIQKQLRMHVWVRTYLAALWSGVLARMDGSLVTVKQGSEEQGQRAAGRPAPPSSQPLVTAVTQMCSQTKIRNMKELTEW